MRSHQAWQNGILSKLLNKLLQNRKQRSLQHGELLECYQNTDRVQTGCKKNPSSELPRQRVSEKTDRHQQKKPQEQSRGFPLLFKSQASQLRARGDLRGD